MGTIQVYNSVDCTHGVVRHGVMRNVGTFIARCLHPASGPEPGRFVARFLFDEVASVDSRDPHLKLLLPHGEKVLDNGRHSDKKVARFPTRQAAFVPDQILHVTTRFGWSGDQQWGLDRKALKSDVLYITASRSQGVAPPPAPYCRVAVALDHRHR